MTDFELYYRKGIRENPTVKDSAIYLKTLWQQHVRSDFIGTWNFLFEKGYYRLQEIQELIFICKPLAAQTFSLYEIGSMEFLVLQKILNFDSSFIKPIKS